MYGLGSYDLHKSIFIYIFFFYFVNYNTALNPIMGRLLWFFAE